MSSHALLMFLIMSFLIISLSPLMCTLELAKDRKLVLNNLLHKKNRNKLKAIEGVCEKYESARSHWHVAGGLPQPGIKPGRQGGFLASCAQWYLSQSVPYLPFM